MSEGSSAHPTPTPRPVAEIARGPGDGEVRSCRLRPDPPPIEKAPEVTRRPDHQRGSLQMVKASLDQRFWAKVDRRGDGECWPWTARTGGPGYGYIDDRPAHRVAYELTIGPIPLGLVIDHLCRNRICVNPQHLEVVTPLSLIHI